MTPPVKKVIRASAGAGKTYRLSLEYIALLLNYASAGLHFSEILVITFTKKATAEIRERIFAQLAAIVEGTAAGIELTRNLEQFSGRTVGAHELEQLRRIRLEMLMNKHLVQISTIDSFTNMLFKTVIAPYLGIGDYVIRERLDDAVQDELYRAVLEDGQSLETFRAFFTRAEKKKIQDFERFFKSVIDKRWVFHLIDTAAVRRPFDAVGDRVIQESFSAFREKFSRLFAEMSVYAQAKDAAKTSKDWLQSDFYAILSSMEQNIQMTDVQRLALKLVDDPKLLERHRGLLLKPNYNLWYYNKVFSKKDESGQKERYLSLQAEMRQSLADFLFYKEALSEERELLAIIRRILARYDELKLRDRVLTYSDITYYTFKYLYDPNLSLIQDDYVLNSFYERLSSVIRFVLIDEFQDTSVIQYKILLPIIRELISGAGVKEYGGVVVVGDEKQSIYGWRGGERDLLLNMPRTLQAAEQITLNASYRSDEKIVDFINTVFDDPALHEALAAEGMDWPYAPVRAHKQNGAGSVHFFLRGFSDGAKSASDLRNEDQVIRQFIQQTLQPLLREQRITVTNTAMLARTNGELSKIAAALDEIGVKYVHDSSNSILDHRAVKPLFYLLEFLLYGDFYDLLKFLRSDVVLLDAKTLKELLLAHRDAEARWHVRALLKQFSRIAAVAKVLILMDQTEQDDLFALAFRAIELFNFTGHFILESDLKNLHRFLMIIADFQQSRHDYPKSLKGLVDYCQDERDNESFRQASLDEPGVISLMTIHKSKGLEFDNVFLYWNLSGGRGHGGSELNDYLIYCDDFSNVQSHLLTFNYDHILEQSSFAEFSERARRREVIEELNNFYVALTRAKSALFVGFAYQNSGGFEEFAKKEQFNVRILLAQRIRAFFDEHHAAISFSAHREQGAFGEIPPPQPAPTTSSAPLSLPHDFFDPWRAVPKAETPEEQRADYHAVFLTQNSITIGNAAHYFLSFVLSGSDVELRRARRKTVAFYGTIIAPERLEAVISALQSFVRERTDIFSSRWSRVFTEHTLFTPEGREVRIDRMMIDEEKRRIEILDFKTGHIFEPEQIDLYVAAVRALPQVQREGYQVNGQFIELKI